MPLDDLAHLAEPGRQQPADLLQRLVVQMREALEELPDAHRGGFVPSDLLSVRLTLQRVLDEGLARGPVFCEWGSGLGAVCAVAASLGFEAYGIEIQDELVVASRTLVGDAGLEATFAHGSYLQPGDEDLGAEFDHTWAETTHDVYRELGIAAESCDVVFAYPWPGEEDIHDRLFARRATPGALLITYHDTARVLVQRRTEDAEELQPLGWMGALDV